MGCIVSKLEEEEEEVVSMCRSRKKQLKLAVGRRYNLADAHHRYYQALNGVSAAIKLFVARHSSPSSPYLITFAPPCPSIPPPPPHSQENEVSNPLFLHQEPSSQPTQETACCLEPCFSDSASEKEEGREEIYEKKEEKLPQASVCGYFFMEMEMPREALHSTPTGFGWDLFNPFHGYNQISEEDLNAVREREGIPDLEKEEEEEEICRAESRNVEKGVQEIKAVESRTDDLKPEGPSRMTAMDMDTPLEGRELLEALKDIEDHFTRAYDSGKEVSRMLEASWVHTQPNLEDLKGHTTKLALTLSSKSLVASSSKSSSTWSDFSNDPLCNYEGVGPGSHSLTLGRLYAWEKKLHEEVKNGDITWKLYEKRCKKLGDQDEGKRPDKTGAAIKELHSRVLVAIRSAETISERIQKLRDEELQPQIIELLQGMMRAWKIMLESHEIQNKIMLEVSSFNSPAYGKFCNNSHRLATLQLHVELQNWRSCFKEYIAAQKAYVESLHGWLSKFLVSEIELYSKKRSVAPPCLANGPPLLTVCHHWLSAMNKLPDNSVSSALKSCAKDAMALWVQQGEELQQKRRVDSLSKELERKTLAFQKTETRINEFNLTDRNSELEVEHRAVYLREQKDLLDNYRKRVESEREQHQKCVQETQRNTLRGFQAGFGGLFESMSEFSRAAMQMYNDVLSAWEYSQKLENAASVEASQAEEDVKR